MKNTIVFVTGNAKKVEHINRYLEYKLEHYKLDLPEIQSLNIDEVVEHKAKEAFNHLGIPLLVEDVALTFEGFGKLPGPFIKWFLQEIGNRELCWLLNGHTNRNALAQVCFGLHDGKKVQLFKGERKGTIAFYPRGSNNMGWESIFIPKGKAKTWGEMDIEEQKETSMRRIALQKLELYLRENWV